MMSFNLKNIEKPTTKSLRGFTLIELLVVIGILAILLAITLIAINPARQFQQANDTQRKSDVLAILNAINQYSSENKGELPGDGLGPGGTDVITTTVRPVSSTDANLCSILVTKYLAGLPTDPLSAHAGNPVTNCTLVYNTGYTVVRSTDNRVTVAAPQAEATSSVEISR